MKISDIILNQGIERRFRGPRKPRLKQVGLHNRMKNLLDDTQINESGSAPGVGPIHRDEIKATLTPLSNALGVDLVSQALGSVGKKQFSGDIDVAIKIPPEKSDEFGEMLKNHPLISYYAKTSVHITKIKIQNYDPNREMFDPKTKKSLGVPEGRTGFVQLDFMPGDPKWMKTYYHSPHEEDSKYKGVHRNIMIASIAGRLNVAASDEKTEDGRPMEMERWMWSSNGLVRVRRTPVPKKNGEGYTKKNNNEVIGGPYYDDATIAKKLQLDSPADMDSFESLYTAVKKNYPEELTQKIFKDFKSNPSIQNAGVPTELSEGAKSSLRESDARIQHVEDFAIWHGSKGVAKSIETLKNLEKSPENVTVKWDGSPAVIFGRNENGEFVLTDKSGFGAKGYDGKVTSKNDMASMFLRRGKEAPDANRKAFVKQMTNIWDIYEAATPENFRGYVHGDLLYFTKPSAEDGHFVFTPNTVTYRVRGNSDIGKQISKSQSGVVLHAKIELDGTKSKVDTSELNSGNLLIMPPVTLTKGPRVQADDLDKVASIANSSANKIDMLLDDNFLKSNKLSSFKNALYTYVNNMTKARKLNNLTGDWSKWIATAKMSEQMKDRMNNHVNNNAAGMKALFTVIMGIMKVKNDIIAQLDASDADVEAYTNGQRGGEGYVIGQGDSKLVNRSGFSAANMTKER